jgi:pimeloyl-ACP methyl ester carboxylesterase
MSITADSSFIETEVSMHRQFLRLAAIAVLVLSACTTIAKREYVSDRISVVARGSGPDVILIPGLTGHRDEAWGGAAETLDDRYRLHLVQVKGFAGIAPGANAEGPVSAPVAEEIARYIREVDLARPAVIGHSMGGTIGMMLAARHPDVVGRLMVVDMTPFMGELFGPAGATPDGLRGIADQARAQILEDPPGTGFIAQLFEGMTLDAEMQSMLMRHARESDRRTVANAFHEVIVTDLRPELSRITAPVTVLYVHPPNVQVPPQQFEASMARLYANATNARLVKIDDSRHFIQWDQPARFTAEVDVFMTR